MHIVNSIVFRCWANLLSHRQKETKAQKARAPLSFLLFTKEIVERRHGESIEFLFLPKMGLLDSQACKEKKCWL